ncbi:MAG: GPH family glycoside/pentoside/hexuronide:cation symporter [Rickettsiales bacterium]|jgi:GPH family glycoside/pentoside/hexuronide:cation symporter
MRSSKSELSKKSLVSYSLLAFCLSFIGLPLYIYLPNYYADNFGVSLQVIAIILLATRLFDTIQDPIFGIISDKLPHLKKKIICYFSPLLGISFLLLFHPLKIFSIEVWLVIFLITTYSFFSIIYINYQSYAVSFSEDYHTKTKIISYREFAFIFGIIFAAASPAIIFRYFSEVDSFLFIGIAFFTIISAFALNFYFYAPQNTYKKESSGNLKAIFQIQILRKYFTIFFLNAVSSSIPAVLILFFVENVINAKNLVGLFLILYFSGLLIGVVLWTRLSKILNNKVKTFVISILFTVFIFIWCYFLGEGDVLFYAIICVLSGIGFGGDFALSYSILTDLIQKHRLENNQTTIFGITNFIIKISLTLSSSILIYCIGAFENDAVYQKQFISFSYALLPIIFRVLAAFTLHKNFK